MSLVLKIVVYNQQATRGEGEDIVVFICLIALSYLNLNENATEDGWI